MRRIATKYLTNPEQVTIKQKTATASTIRQRFWPVSGVHKLDALTRILEAEEFDAMIVFVRTKNSTVELADKLEARGYAAAAINGDIQQKQRERSIQNLKNGKLDILVATDVAARGLDVPRISHVINYDIPHDTESYIHRIGRTGRAGREGDAILFVAPREKRLLSAIERATKKPIDMMELPSTEIINEQRIEKFKQRITDTLESQKLDMFYKMIEEYERDNETPALNIAAALAHLLQGQSPFLLQNKPQKKMDKNWKDSSGSSDRKPSRRERERNRGRDGADDRNHDRKDKKRDRSKDDRPPAEDMASFRIEVGNNHDVRPGNIVGAIANEAGLDSKNIGHIKIYDDYSLVDLPIGMPKDVFNELKKVWVSGQQLNISRLVSGGEKRAKKEDKKKSKNRKRDKKNIGKRKAPKKTD
ncbi:DEAD-box ATP-dependent RNA helicase DeaD (= CshA) [hydrothermal vent metagenome]|uniref:RNA helicase n=1 Tax=hydrothermal vent metagenome TaxID=652676 RepID=A0A3B0X8L5_9ZZZZ